MKIYAHRGFSAKFKEATLAAYQAAIDAGADGLECDVRLTKDDIPVCFHDRNTKRIAGAKKRVATLTLTELRGITGVLTLEELLDLAKKNNKEVLIETKHPVFSGRRVERKVTELGKQYKFTAMSFSLFAVLLLKKNLNDVAYVVARRWRLLFIPTKKVAVDIDLFAKSPWTRKRLANKEVLLWTVNDEKFLPLAKEWGVAALITDDPGKFTSLR